MVILIGLPELCFHKLEMHKLSSQFITLHCSSFILKSNTYAQNYIPFKMAKMQRKNTKSPNQNLKSKFNLMSNT